MFLKKIKKINDMGHKKTRPMLSPRSIKITNTLKLKKRERRRKH